MSYECRCVVLFMLCFELESKRRKGWFEETKKFSGRDGVDMEGCMRIWRVDMEGCMRIWRVDIEGCMRIWRVDMEGCMRYRDA